MNPKFKKYQEQLDALINRGDLLHIAMLRSLDPEGWDEAIKKEYKEKAQSVIDSFPDFKKDYQTWYSEAKSLIKQVLPDRLDDFVRHYEKPKGRKDITYENYRIEDFLQGLRVTSTSAFEGKREIVGPTAARPQFEQQRAILAAVKARFESALFDIQQLVQADVFDSELDAARELLKSGYTRASGALAGVVLERHLGQVVAARKIPLVKKHPTIATFNDALKDGGAIDVPTWRFIQHLGDIRNLCDHAKTPDPTPQQVTDLIEGTAKVTKTVF